MAKKYWDNKLDYLNRNRFFYFNSDYIDFLIRCVWKISRPVSLVDFGCGTGNIGSLFLPFFPQGSNYTGIDKSKNLISAARKALAELPNKTEFIVEDVNNIDLKNSFDIAICQALLLHLSNPRDILKKMYDCLKKKGILICIEPHWNTAMANFYIHEINYFDTVNFSLLQKIFENDRKKTGKDGNIGIKIPVYMHELGLQNINCRISDCLRYNKAATGLENEDEFSRLLAAEGFSSTKISRIEFIRNLRRRGATTEEAEKQYEIEAGIGRIMEEPGGNYNILFGPAMIISFGTKGE